MAEERVRVVLVFGGVSAEHEISCLTAGSVARAIDTERFDVIGVGISRAGDWVRIGHDELVGYEVADGVLPQVAADRPAAVVLAGGEIATREGDRLVDRRPIDVAFALLHGPYGEDGTIQGLFEMLGVRYVGSGVAASAIGMDKDLMKRAMAAAGLPVGPWEAITPAQWRDDRQASLDRANRLRYPLYVKPARGGSSLGIVRVESSDALEAAIEVARAFDPKVVVEQGFVGCREIEVSVLENPDGPPRVSLPGEILMHTEDAFYDFEAKYLPEEQVTLQVPAELTPELLASVRALATRTFSAMAVEGLARVDLFVDAADVPYVNELNTMPGFTRHSMFPMMWAASGVQYPELIATLVELALNRPLGLR
ncbi:MAG TPA: D-alanine--D-alanine ligase family protein [Propionicimonas sp.]|nr:D-alanine--D-alanine ligase family protein [Propionicimonas sp.]HRA05052.1 D-alanine--D-alanine ligase family protein [Propionicimonas sp.]